MNFEHTPAYTSSTAYAPSEIRAGRSSDAAARSWVRHPLTLILALQSALSLSLVSGNTAFTDEAEYLWTGHLEIAHWLHGAPLPGVLTQSLSGSPVIYPPLGALADSVGGLAGARVLSLAFMLLTTLLLHSVAKKLFDQSVATLAAVLWAISESAVRLGAFATYDAFSILLTALSVWLALRIGTDSGRSRYLYVAASAAALAIANGAAYSGVVIDPVVVTFAFFSWATVLGARRARFLTAWFVVAILLLLAGVLTISHSWREIEYTIILRGSAGGFTYSPSPVTDIVKNVWVYSGLFLALSLIGLIVAWRNEPPARLCLLGTAALATLVVPIAQLHDHTEVSLDKHLAYGIWFAAMVCGYGGRKLIRSLTGMRAPLVVACCLLALAYPVIGDWQAAQAKQLSWANSTDFVNALRPIAAAVPGAIDASSQGYVAQYYTPQGAEWSRWDNVAFQTYLPNIPANRQLAFYKRQLAHSRYGLICLFYATTVRGLPDNLVLSPGSNITHEKLLNMVAGSRASDTGSVTGLAALTLALEEDHAYRLAAVGPYSSNINTGVFSIWEKVAAS